MKLGLTTALTTHHRIKDLLAGLAYPISWLRTILSGHMAHSDGAANDANSTLRAGGAAAISTGINPGNRGSYPG